MGKKLRWSGFYRLFVLILNGCGLLVMHSFFGFEVAVLWGLAVLILLLSEIRDHGEKD